MPKKVKLEVLGGPEDGLQVYVDHHRVFLGSIIPFRGHPYVLTDTHPFKMCYMLPGGADVTGVNAPPG